MGSKDLKVQYKNAKDKVVIEEEDETDPPKNESCFGQIKRMPKQTWPILITELCERFSYYGIKAVLVLYLTQDLMYDKYRGKSIYHAFSMVSYFTGVLGAMIADSFLGKYKTIFISLLLYSVGELALTVLCVPDIGRPFKAGPLLALLVTAIACGNIKPCLAAFGGDQFDQKETSLISKFFSMFYMSVNVGATFTMIFVPMIRTDITCFGGDCYPAAFGVPMVFIVVATVSFILASKWYVKKAPEGNMMIRVFKIIWHALTQGWENRRKGIKYSHWLEHAQDQYSIEEIGEVRALLKVLVMYIPLPVFWALFHQQGSSWTLQAEQMDGDLGKLGTLRSDQIQFFNPVLVLILIPFFDSIVYPIFERCRCGLSPLKKMTGGMILAALAFVICGFVQIKIQTINSPPPAPSGSQTSVEFINVSPCTKVSIDPSSFFGLEIGYAQRTSSLYGNSGNHSFEIEMSGCFSANKSSKVKGRVTVNLRKTYETVLINLDDSDSPMVTPIMHDYGKASIETANSRLRLLYGSSNLSSRLNVTIKHALESKKDKSYSLKANVPTKDFEVPSDEYSLIATRYKKGIPIETNKMPFKLGTFGAYTIAIMRKAGTANEDELYAQFFEDIKSNSVHRIWQLPQYVVLTAGEVMFSVTGLEFAYSQAPTSMKSVLQACWLVTVAFGDLLVIIFSEAKPVKGVEKEMFLYGGFMGIIVLVFGFMATFYRYSDFSGKKAEEQFDEKEILGEIGAPSISSSTTTL